MIEQPYRPLNARMHRGRKAGHTIMHTTTGDPIVDGSPLAKIKTDRSITVYDRWPMAFGIPDGSIMRRRFGTDANEPSFFMHGITRLSTIAVFDPTPPGYLWGMRIAIGSDHAGFRLKQELVQHLLKNGLEVEDEGTRSEESTDYPGYAHAVASAVAAGQADLGIVICGSGNGVNITANKHHGIRSALAWNVEVAQLARQHNNANVLALPARYLGPQEAMAITDAFLAAGFEGGRHQRRVAGIEHID